MFTNFFKGLGGLAIITGSLIAYPVLWIFFKVRALVFPKKPGDEPR